MEEITFSIINHGQAASEALQALLHRFEQKCGIRVRLEIIPNWTLGWSRLIENALYHSGPDISETGNSWIGDLTRMEALHLFSREEVIEITKDVHLFENVWRCRTKVEHGQATIYSIPWTGDTRAVFYRRDLLEKAGVDPATAFADTARFAKTISALKEWGIPVPLALTSQYSTLTIQYIASWIWCAGGDFFSQDGINLAFSQPRAMEACKAYFRLGRYLVPEARNLGEDEVNRLFRSGRAAVTLNGYWMLNIDEMAADTRENFGVASMPGSPFVGGQDLIIWNHSRHVPAAIKLIQFLLFEEAGKELFPLYGLPVSESGWENFPFNTGFYPVFKKAILTGRGFQGQLWGLVEKRLTDEFAEIWAEILKSPDSQLDIIVETRLNNLAQRLQLSMGS